MEKNERLEKIAKALHKNCKLTLEQLAVMFDMDTKAVAEIIDTLEKDGSILGYGAIVNWDKLSRDDVTAYIEIKVSPQRHNGFDRLAERICQNPQVKDLYLMSGSYDFGILVEGKDIREISLFVSEHLAPMESVISTATHFVLKCYKKDSTILNNPQKDDRGVISL